MRVVALRDIDERQRPEVALHQRDVGGEPRHALVHILERLKVGQLHHCEECLLERVVDRGGGGENLVEALLDERRHLGGMIDRSADADRVGAQPPTGGRLGQQVFGKQRVEIAERVAVETDLARVLREQLDRGFVVEDHLRLMRGAADGGLAGFQQALGLEQRVGVALQPARIPRQVDQQPVHDLAQVRARRQRLARRAAERGEFFPKRRRKIRGHIGPVAVEKRKYIAHRLARSERPGDQAFGFLGGARQQDRIELRRRLGDETRLGRGCGRQDGFGHEITTTPPGADRHDAPLGNEQRQPPLHAPARRQRLERLVNRIHGGTRRLPGKESDQSVELRGRKGRRHVDEVARF